MLLFFLRRRTERVLSDLRLDLCLVTRFNHFCLDRIPLSALQVCPRYHYAHPTCDRPPCVLGVRYRFWTIARSNGHPQVLTSRTWQTVEIWADLQTDSPLGGNLDLCRGPVRDRFVPSNPRQPT